VFESPIPLICLPSKFLRDNCEPLRLERDLPDGSVSLHTAYSL